MSATDPVEAAFRRNAICVVGWEAIWALGTPSCIVWTVVPAYLLFLGASKTLVQVVMVGFTVASVVQLISPRLIHGARRKSRTFWVWTLFCLVFVVYGLAALAAWSHLPRWAWVSLFIGACACMAVTMNLGSPAYNELVIENIPQRKRGRVGALRMFFLGTFGLVGARFAAWLMDRWPEPANFHHAMVIGSGIMTVSCLAIAFVKDEAQANRDAAEPKVRVLKAARELLGNFNFRIFLVCYGLNLAALVQAPLLIGYGKDVVGMLPAEVALFTAAYFVGPILLGTVVMPLADRYGFRLIGIMGAMMTMICFSLPILWQHRLIILGAYVLYAGSASLMPLLCSNLGVELVPTVKPSILMAVANLLVMPLALLLAPIGGRLVDLHGEAGYLATFVMGASFAFASLLGMIFLVREPRTGQVIYVGLRH